jgi:hypothetical protein
LESTCHRCPASESAIAASRSLNDIKLPHLPCFRAHGAVVVELAGFRRQVLRVGARQHRFDAQQLVIVVLDLGGKTEVGIRIDIVRVRGGSLGILCKYN